jgi:hypothetical protein
MVDRKEQPIVIVIRLSCGQGPTVIGVNCCGVPASCSVSCI